MALYDLFDLDTKFGQYPAQTGEASITAGDFLKPTGSTEATTSNYNSSNLISVSMCDANGDEAYVCGIAMQDQATSGGNISVGTKGIFLLQANEAITAGTQVCQIAAAASMKVIPAEAGGRQLGIALTSCDAQDEYVLVLFQLGPTGAEA